MKSHSKGYSGVPELYIAGGEYGLLVRTGYSDGLSKLILYCNFDARLLLALHELSGWNYVYPQGFDPPQTSFWYADESLCFYGWAGSVSTIGGHGSILSEFKGNDKYLTLIVHTK